MKASESDYWAKVWFTNANHKPVLRLFVDNNLVEPHGIRDIGLKDRPFFLSRHKKQTGSPPSAQQIQQNDWQEIFLIGLVGPGRAPGHAGLTDWEERKMTTDNFVPMTPGDLAKAWPDYAGTHDISDTELALIASVSQGCCCSMWDLEK